MKFKIDGDFVRFITKAGDDHCSLRIGFNFDNKYIELSDGHASVHLYPDEAAELAYRLMHFAREKSLPVVISEESAAWLEGAPLISQYKNEIKELQRKIGAEKIARDSVVNQLHKWRQQERVKTAQALRELSYYRWEYEKLKLKEYEDE